MFFEKLFSNGKQPSQLIAPLTKYLVISLCIRLFEIERYLDLLR